jgi:hypothetical protein
VKKQQPNNEAQNEASTQNKSFRNTNANEHITNGQAYQVFPEGVRVSKTKLVRGIKMEHRQKALYSIGLNTLALNPDLSEDEIFNSLCSINNNKKQINIPLKYNDLKKITAMIFKKRDDEGELAPDINHTRYVIFDTVNYPMTKQEIRQVVGKVTGELKKAKTKQSIYEAIESWDKPEKITINKLSILLRYSERTIKNYWSEFKDYVKTINANIKSNNPKPSKVFTETPEQVPETATIQLEPSIMVYDTPESFHKIYRQHNPSTSSDTIRHCFDTMAEAGIERTEANIQDIISYKHKISM